MLMQQLAAMQYSALYQAGWITADLRMLDNEIKLDRMPTAEIMLPVTSLILH